MKAKTLSRWITPATRIRAQRPLAIVMSVDASEASSSFSPGRSLRAGAASCQISLYPSDAYNPLAAVLAPSTCSEMAGRSHEAAAVSHCAHRRRARPWPRVLGATARLASRPKTCGRCREIW